MICFQSSIVNMKLITQIIIFYAVSVAVLYGAPVTEEGDERVNGENGWYVPQINGSFRWMSLKEADQYLEDLEENRKITANPVQFFLYTRNGSKKGEKIIATTNSISSSKFNPKKPTRFTVHGWSSGKGHYVNEGVRRAWLNKEDCNMIAVVWSRAKSLDYGSSVLAVPGVGKKIANFIDFLVENYQVNLNMIDLIGHSLGAHVVGHAGKNVKSGNIHALYGLDPALPLYKYNKPQTRLNSTDGKYVETIHTNGGKLGFLKPIGSGSFYPNGGQSQPGCGLDLTGSCSHSRAVYYFVEAIEKDNFASLKCDNYEEAVANSCASTYTIIRMASKKNPIISLNGEYLVPVRETSPYGMLS